MRVLQVILAFYPCKIWGGPPQNTLILSKGLQARGHEVEILATNIIDHKTRMSSRSFRGEWEGIPVTYLKSTWWGKRANSIGFVLAPDLWNYRHLIRDADIIHIQGNRHFLFVGSALLALAYRIPYILHTRGTLLENRNSGRVGLKKLFDYTLGRVIFSNAKGAVALSDPEIAAYLEFGVPKTRIRKILNPFDPSTCPNSPDPQKFRMQHQIREDEKIVLFLSRLHEGKGLDLLIQAIAEIARPDIRLCIVGPDCGYQAIAEKRIEKLNLRHSVVITGPLYGKEKYDAYSAANVYVLPSQSEGQPTTAMEACYVGVPIIITRTCEMADIIDGRVGLAIDYDLRQLINALTEVLYDPALQQKFKSETDAFMKDHLSLSKALDNFEYLYRASHNSEPRNAPS